MTQTELREKVIFAIYDMLLGGDSHQEKDPKTTICGIFEADYEEIPLYCRKLFIKSLINKDEIIKKIEPNLNRWTFNRLNYVIQAMLIASYTERNILKGADKKVIINEAVNFAKKYADNLDYKFVNAVLDKVLI